MDQLFISHLHCGRYNKSSRDYLKYMEDVCGIICNHYIILCDGACTFLGLGVLDPILVDTEKQLRSKEGGPPC